ncbi:MAG: PP2C family protein-serine/threonine phosphatase [Patescibacteria group bacterium]
MIEVIRNSLVKRILIKLFVLVLVQVAVFAYLIKQNVTLSVEVFAGILAANLLVVLLIYYFDFSKPMKKLLVEMEALLSGKPYKKIFTSRLDEIGVLAFFFNQVTSSLSEVSYDIKDRNRLIDELTVAAELQREILPLISPTVKGLQLVAKTKPATEVGGDIFNFISRNGKTYIYMGDVTGHGVAAGLIMTMATSLMSVFADIYTSPYDILVNVNKYIKRHVKKTMFLTLVMLCWDEAQEKMTFVGAGHEYILVYRAAEGICEAVLSGGVALGMVPDNSKIIKESEIKLNDGDFIILYSDGIVEARNQAGELYGLERLKQSVIQYASQYSAEGLNYHVATEVSNFNKGHIQDDDMSLIVIKRDKTLNAVTVDTSTNWSLKE